ncbi:MBL fold metallo-hydrolase [Candidatus Bathyarchaeota archaeon]|nr:MAG: MBL fold metallo-hydrolase [Candidatus Bathyarchaeota archaeon]
MHTVEIAEHLSLIDLEPAHVENLIASYIVRGKRVGIIETGPASTVQNLLSGLNELDVKLEDVTYVAVTHIHLDHGGGAGALLKELPNAKLVLHPRGVPHMANPEKLWSQATLVLGERITELYGKPEPVPEDRMIAASDGMILDFGEDVKLRVVETLGHASHHLSYYDFLTNGIFVGDSAGIYIEKAGAVVPTTPPPFRLDIALKSLDKLLSLKPDWLYYTHFGRGDKALKRLEAYKSQLKLWAEIAKDGLEKGETLEKISERIFREDAAAQRALKFVEENPVLSVTVLKESVEGILGFVKKFRY